MPQGSPAIDQLLAALGKAARGSHQSRLDARTLNQLESFATYLVKNENLAASTARVYKSLCAKALAQGAPDLNNKVMMSALAALRRWRGL